MKRWFSSFAVLLTLCTLTGIGLEGSAMAEEPKEESGKRRVLKLKDVPTETKSEFYRAKAREKRHQVMNFLQDILKNNPPRGEQKAEMLLRLADLFFEEGRDIYLTEMETYRGQFDSCFNTPGCNTETMKANNAGSEKWQNKSIRIYNVILKTYPQFRRADEATFFLASALQDTGKPDAAVKEFTRLVRTYPKSRFAADAYVMIGEYYFENNNAYKALLAYKEATKFKSSPKYGFAMYKLAWCYYNVGEYGKAIDTMKAVVSFSMTAQEGGGDKSRLTLQDEALKDLVRFFADAGEMDEAYAYFTKLGKPDLIRAMLRKLAKTYFEQGKFQECIRTYKRLISEDANSPKAPDYQNEIILAHQKIGQKRETLAQIQFLLKTYGKNSAWERANSADQDAIREAQGYIEKNLRTVANNYHLDGKKLRTGKEAKESYQYARYAYKKYLAQFPDSKYSYDMRHNYGELLYDIKKYAEAYEQYMKVVQTDPKGKHSRFCASAAIFASEKEMEREKAQGKTPTVTSKTEAVELSPWENNFVAANNQWQQLFPDDKKTKDSIYKVARLLYSRNHFKEASDKFRIVIKMDPRSKEAIFSAHQILDSFTLVEDWGNLKEVAKAFRDQEGLGNTKFKGEVAAIYEKASFQVIDVERKRSKDDKKAADSLMYFYKEFPGSSDADLALNNAAVYYHDTGHEEQAMGARLQLVEKFPKSKFYNNTIAALAFNYEGIADFERAAKYYEELFKLDPKHKAAKEAIYSAGLFRKALGNSTAAVINYNHFIKNFPDDKRVNGLKISIVQTFEKDKKWTQTAKLYQQFFSSPAGKTADQLFFAKLHYGLALEAMGQKGKAKTHYTQMVKDYHASKAGKVEMEQSHEFTARVMLKLARPELEHAMGLKISGPTFTVNKNNKNQKKKESEILLNQLKAKAAAVKAVEQKYGEILQTGAGEYGLAAIVDLGKLYENLANSLRDSYVPPYLNEGQKEIYSETMEDKAYPPEEKAANTFKQALDKAYELNLYNDHTEYAVRRLGELRPADYPGLSEDLLTPRYTSRSVNETTFEPSL
jgi:tetratricopeptide (TPR) repeat protein